LGILLHLSGLTHNFFPLLPYNPPITLIEQVQNTWISFARNGDPNHSDLPVWPRYNEKDKPKMVFNVNQRVENDPDGVLRKKWKEVMG